MATSLNQQQNQSQPSTTWWDDEFPIRAAKREPMPAVERWQTTYVRYKEEIQGRRAPEAQVGDWKRSPQ